MPNTLIRTAFRFARFICKYDWSIRVLSVSITLISLAYGLWFEAFIGAYSALRWYSISSHIDKGTYLDDLSEKVNVLDDGVISKFIRGALKYSGLMLIVVTTFIVLNLITLDAVGLIGWFVNGTLWSSLWFDAHMTYSIISGEVKLVEIKTETA